MDTSEVIFENIRFNVPNFFVEDVEMNEINHESKFSKSLESRGFEYKILNKKDIVLMSTLDHYKNVNAYMSIIKSIDHKNIAKFQDISLIDNIYFLKLEIDHEAYVDLSIFIKSQTSKLGEDYIGNTIFHLLSAIKYLHKENIFHSFINSKSIYVKKNYGTCLKLSNLCFIEKGNDLVNTNRNIYYKCSTKEQKNLTLAYDLWCAGWVLYELCMKFEFEGLLNDYTFDVIDWKPPSLDRYKKNFNSTFTKLVEPYWTKRNLDEILSDENNELFYYILSFSWAIENQILIYLSADENNFEECLKSKGYLNPNLINRGSFGSVYLADDPKDPNANLKAFKFVKIEDKSRIPTERELNILEKLSSASTGKVTTKNHPNLVMFYNYFATASYYCIKLEYFKEGDLKKFLKDYKDFANKKNQPVVIPDKTLHSWFKQLFDGLKFIHEIAAHRDIKPANIMLSNNSTVLKYIDFGLAKEIDNNNPLVTNVGSPRYKAPELINSQEKREYKKSADIWSLGCVLYECVELKYAFDGTTINELVLQVCSGEYPFLENIRFSSILKKMFLLDPNERMKAEDLFNMI